MRLKAAFLLIVDAHMAAAGVPESAVSRRLFGAGNRIRALRLGGDMGSAGLEDALQQLSDEWPEGAVWPEQVSRPAPRTLRPDAADPGAVEDAAPRRRRSTVRPRP